jgi:hypothetical protein
MADFPTLTSLFARFEANANVLEAPADAAETGDPVTEWNQVSGTATGDFDMVLIGATEPTFLTSAGVSHAIDFDGTDDGLVSTSATELPSPRTVTVAFKLSTLQAGRRTIWSGSTSEFEIGKGATTHPLLCIDGNVALTTSHILDTEWTVVSFVAETGAGNALVYVNGEEIHDAGVFASTCTGQTVGRLAADADEASDMLVIGIVLNGAALDATEIGLLHQYYNDQYSLGIPALSSASNPGAGMGVGLFPQDG